MSDQTKTYNGWTNYETWNVNLWLDNEYGSYQDMQEAARDYRGNPAGMAAYIKEYVEDQNPLADSATMFSDLLGAALSEVDWYEIAEHYLADLEPEDPEPAECPLCGAEVDELVTVNGKWDMCEDCEARFLDGEIDFEGNEIGVERCAICAEPMDPDDTDEICADCGIGILDDLTDLFGWWYREVIEAGTLRHVDVFIYDVDYPFDGVHAIDTNTYSRE